MQSEGMNISRRGFLKTLGGLVLFNSIPQSAAAFTEATYPYSVQKVNNEYRLFREGRQHENKHFMSIITEDDFGKIFCIRPHPDGGSNDNAWGSTLYMQPFLPGATLRDTVVSQPIIDNEADSEVNGITISASGKVCRGNSDNLGNWTFQMKFSYVNGRIESTRAGEYSITLNNQLASFGDLNLFKLASNFLIDVPLLGGGRGNTGDMSKLEILFNDRPERIWTPSQGTTYPQDFTNILTLNLIGNYNNVDTLAQGLGFRIEPAYKPNIRLRLKRLTSDEVRTKMFLGTAFDSSQAQNFEKDNVAILPLIPQSAPEKVFNFDVSFESTSYKRNSVNDWNRYR